MSGAASVGGADAHALKEPLMGDASGDPIMTQPQQQQSQQTAGSDAAQASAAGGGAAPASSDADAAAATPQSGPVATQFTQLEPPRKKTCLERGVHRRTAWLALFLGMAQVAACTLFCWSIWWAPLMFYCTRFDTTTWDHLDPNGDPVCLPYPSTCSPMQISVILDIFVTNCIIVLYWFIGEEIREIFGHEVNCEIWTGRQWQKVLDKRNYAAFLEPPAHLLEYPGEYGTKAYEENFAWKNNCSLKKAVHSQQWNDELKMWYYLKDRADKQNNTAQGKQLRTLALNIFFLFVGVLVMYLVLSISPKHYHNEKETWGDFILEAVKDTVIPEMDGAYTILIVIQFCLELLLFMVAVIVVKWPKAALIRATTTQQEQTVKTLNRIHRANQPQLLELDEHAGLVQDTCLLIACHKSCVTAERTHTFANTLRAALKVFPPKAIFVCDNAPSLNPWDRTEQVCESVSRGEGYTGDQKINYLFIPEGNKSHAMYWCTEYWIPELVRRGESVDFKYAMMIDDDVPLPPDLHVPLHTLDRENDIKAVCYVIRAATENGEPNQLVALQDAEYKLAGLVKQAQWRFGTTLCCHGAIALWRRDVLGKQILWDHDTEFHGEDMYMGLLLHRLRKDYAIMVSAGAVVPTFAPENLAILFRQRVSSWDLCAQRKFTTQLRELFGGLCNTRTWILKPFMLQEIISVMLDYMRLYLLIALGQRNPIGLLLCFIFFYIVLYIEVIIFNVFVLRDRHDLQLSWKTVLLFPFYRTALMFFRIYALFVNILQYTRPKKPTISWREDNTRDLPPCPPMANPDWFTVWHVNPEKGSQTAGNKHEWQTALKEASSKLCRELNRNRTETHRLECFVESYLLVAILLEENSTVSFPECLREKDRDPETIAACFSMLEDRILDHLKMQLGVRWRTFYDEILLEKEKLEINLYSLSLEQIAAVSTPQEVRETMVQFNHAILVHVSELIYDTRYPKSHDKAAEVKKALQHLMDLLVQRRRMTTQKLVGKILVRLEAMRKTISSRQIDEYPACLAALDDIEAAVATVQEEWKVKILNTSKGFRRKMEKVLRRQAQGLPTRPKAVTVGRVEPGRSVDGSPEQESSVADGTAGQRDSQQWPRPKLSKVVQPESDSDDEDRS